MKHEPIKVGAELNEAAENIARNLRTVGLAPIWIVFLCLSCDLPTFATALWFAQYATQSTDLFSPTWAAAYALLGAAVSASIITAVGGYRCQSLSRYWSSLALAFLSFAPVLAAFFFFSNAVSTFNAALVFLLVIATVLLPTRLGAAHAARWMLDTGLLARRAVIAGGGEHAARLIRGLADKDDSDIRLHGIFDDRDDIRSPLQILGVPKIGGYQDLVRFVRKSEIDLVIIALPLEAEARISWLLKEFKVLPVEVRLSAFSQDFTFAKPGFDPLPQAIRRSFAPERRLIKRAFDVTIATGALMLLWPIMALAALAIRLESSGPILFQQNRHGYNDKIIKVLKFRSMYHNMSDPEARNVVTKGDPRVTKVGRFLRKSSIDELPQLINVLRGDLSLVGPRPHAVNALSSDQRRFSQMVEGYSARHRLPPGITGWAQINGWRGEIDDPNKLSARFEHDLFYIENWSLWFDIKILLRTPTSLFNTKSAY